MSNVHFFCHLLAIKVTSTSKWMTHRIVYALYSCRDLSVPEYFSYYCVVISVVCLVDSSIHDDLLFQGSPVKHLKLSASAPMSKMPTSPTRRVRGETKKCRKVYGMEHRELWCTQCKWKKACSRFGDWLKSSSPPLRNAYRSKWEKKWNSAILYVIKMLIRNLACTQKFVNYWKKNHVK